MGTKNNDSLEEYSFSLKEIQIIAKTLTFINIQKKDKKIEFDFDISLSITTNTERRQSIHFMNVSITSKDDKKNVGTLSIVCIFEIDNFESLVTSKNNEISLPQKLVYLLNTVVIGTIRGIMYSEFRGTILDEAILPVLDPRLFQKQEN
jgi:hypothetical protein